MAEERLLQQNTARQFSPGEFLNTKASCTVLWLQAADKSELCMMNMHRQSLAEEETKRPPIV